MLSTSPRFACHQRATSSGSVQARQTSSRGAANWREIRMVVSVGRVTVARRVVSMSALLRIVLQFVEYGIQQLEAVGPQLFVARQPVGDRLQWQAVDAVDAAPADLACFD